MKTTLASILLPCAALLAIQPLAADTPEAAPDDASFAPKPHPLSRYAHLDKKSPFEFDPPPIERPASVDNFEGVSLGGYCGSGNTLTVYLVTGKEKKRISVYGDGSPFKKLDQTGYRIIKLNESKTLSTTTVLMEKDGQQKEIGFDKETLTAKAGGGGGGQVQMVPGPNGTMVPRPVIPRPTAAPGQTQAYQAPAPFIPGQNNPGQNNPGQNFPGNPQGNPLPNNVPQPVGNMSNQQLVNQLVTTPNAPQFNNPAVVNPAAQPGGTPPVPQRRRVVLPTDSRR
jgi:hypothetical protein